MTIYIHTNTNTHKHKQLLTQTQTVTYTHKPIHRFALWLKLLEWNSDEVWPGSWWSWPKGCSVGHLLTTTLHLSHPIKLANSRATVLQTLQLVQVVLRGDWFGYWLLLMAAIQHRTFTPNNSILSSPPSIYLTIYLPFYTLVLECFLFTFSQS